MPSFELAPIDSVKIEQLHRVLSNPRISKHLPLFEPNIDFDWVKNWVKSKTSQWDDSRLGPYAVLVDGNVVGWAGYQPDGEFAELAIVLSPEAWGLGLDVVEEVDRRWQLHGDGRKRVFYLPKSRRLEIIPGKFAVQYIGETTILGKEFVIFQFKTQGDK